MSTLADRMSCSSASLPAASCAPPLSSPTSRKQMRQSQEKYRHLSVTSGSEITEAEKVCAFLRERHPNKTALNVSADTRIPQKTIEKWLERASAPSFGHSLLLIAAYGPEFLCAVMRTPPAWMTEHGRVQQQTRLADQIADLTRRLTEGSR